MSDTKPQLYAALVKAQRAMQPIVKDTKNDFFKSSYAPLDSVIDAISPALHDNGLAITQPTGMQDNHFGVITTLWHESGESISGFYIIDPKEQHNPQMLGAATTYARRYALMGMLGIAPEDDDGNAASGKNASPATQRPTSTPAATPAREVNTQTVELINDPLCPDCGGRMWDNRAKKASGEYAPNRPDFSCKKRAGNPDCKGAIWPAKDAHPREDDAARSLSMEEEVNQYFGGVDSEPPYQDSDR